MTGHILKSKRLQNLKDRFLKFEDTDTIFRKITMQVDRDALGNMFRKPPAMVAGMFRSITDGSGDPAFVKAGVPPIGESNQRHAIKKCDHVRGVFMLPC